MGRGQHKHQIEINVATRLRPTCMALLPVRRAFRITPIGGMSKPMKALAAIVALLVAFDLTVAKGVPLPRARPVSFHAGSSSASPHLDLLAPEPERILPLHDAEAWPSDCNLQLSEIARFVYQPSINGPGQCGASDIVSLEDVVMPDGSLVTVMPAATLRCPMAEALAHWIRRDLGPATAELDSRLVAVTGVGSYNCRTRNGVPGAKVSEHGHGNALDLGPIRLVNGAMIDLTKPSTPQAFRRRVRDATCNRFGTVLGPGSDAYHVDHIHVDLAERANDYRVCQWDVREPNAMVELPRVQRVSPSEPGTMALTRSRRIVDSAAPGGWPF
jgi:hypothetical protein